MHYNKIEISDAIYVINVNGYIGNSTSKKFLLVQNEGNREVKRNVQYYNLDMVISIGIKSIQKERFSLEDVQHIY